MINQQTIQFIIFFSFFFYLQCHSCSIIGLECFFFGCFWWNSSIFLLHSYTHHTYINGWMVMMMTLQMNDFFNSIYFCLIIIYWILWTLIRICWGVCVCVFTWTQRFFLIGCKKPPWSQILNNTTDLTQNFSRVTEYNVLQFKQT